MKQICKCGHEERYHYNLKRTSGRWEGRKYNICGGSENKENCKCKKFEAKKGCGKQFNLDGNIFSCGFCWKHKEIHLCPNCKPNHSPLSVDKGRVGQSPEKLTDKDTPEDSKTPVDVPSGTNSYIKKWRKKNPDKVREIVKKYRSRNKEKQPAWDKARRGIGAIKIEGLCQICKIEEAKLRHHEDYSKPREVILICSKCHKDIHKNGK